MLKGEERSCIEEKTAVEKKYEGREKAAGKKLERKNYKRKEIKLQWKKIKKQENWDKEKKCSGKKC